LVNPSKIPEADLTYNLLRFGYRELGIEIKEGRSICIEYIASALLTREHTRRIHAIPIILAKNKTNYGLLVFLTQKYGGFDRLLGLLKILHRLNASKDVAFAIELLEALGTKEIKADEKAIQQKMRLYNAIR
jgi:hypothetical protein